MNSPAWIKNENKKEWSFMDGQEFIIAVFVNNQRTHKHYWEIEKVRMDCDGESAAMVYAESGESYDAWGWSDVAFYIEVTPQ